MKIQGVNIVHTPQVINGPHRSAAPAASASSSLAEVDQLDISSTADRASRALDASAIRADRVAQIRSAIEAGHYDSDDKLSLALDRLMDEIA
jgi:anti-sigma28 factor (negative regulator of flagellin synthesis)